MRTVAVSLAAFDGHPLLRSLDTLAELGVTHVEPAYIAGYAAFDESAFDVARAAELADNVAARGLTVRAVSAHTNLGAPDAAPALARRLRFAGELGAQILITNATTTDRHAQLSATLDEVLPVAEDAGVIIALENPGHGSAALIHDGASAARVIGAIGSEYVALNYDVGNVFTYSGEATAPHEDLLHALPYAVHLHLKDVCATAEGYRFCTIGEGSIDYAAVFSVLRKAAPSLPLAIELPLRLARPARADPVRAAEPVPLKKIERAVQASLATLDRHLSGR